MNRHKLIWAKFLVLTVTFLSFGFVKNASALSESEIYNNILANMMNKCYTPLEINSTVNLQQYNARVNGEAAFRDVVLASGGATLYVPTGIGTGNKLKLLEGDVTKITCKELFLGNSNFTGLFGLSGKSVPSPNATNLVDQLKNLGYVNATADAEKTRCINAGYKNAGGVGGASSSAGSICWQLSDLESGEITNEVELMDRASITFGKDVRINFTTTENGGEAWVLRFEETGQHYACESSPAVSFATSNYNAVEFVNKLGAGGNCTILNGVSLEGIYTVSWSIQDKDAGAGQNFSNVSFQSYGLAYFAARNYLAGNGNKYNFTTKDRFELYSLYLSKVYGATYGDKCLSRSEIESSGGPIQTDEYGNKVYYTYYNGGYHNVTIGQNASMGVATFHNDNNFLTSHCGDVECVIQGIWNMNLEENSCTPGPGDDDPKPGSDADKGSCDSIVDEYAEGKIGAMQWILCPAMDNSKYTASWIDDMTQDWLELDPSLYDGTSNTHTAWGYVRNIANIAMIVFLVVIIISQITGYGIDNYGIKKMLPRLIVMAIIINLSFYICELAIDLSNIAGVGLRNMFGSMGNALNNSAALRGTSFLGTMITGIFASAGGVSAGVGVALTGVTLGAPIVVAVIIAVIVMCLVILVAVVVLFLMLGAREIIVILCVAISPLAFAAFILPNTQNLFKKWWDLFKAAIIIYPICGALSGLSFMLRNIAMAGSGDEGTAVHLNVWGYAIMMILPYLGFFLIPTLLKNALSALGKVGGALTSMGQTIRNGGRQLGQSAARVAQNTEGYKNLQTEAARRRQSNSSQRTIDKLNKIKAEKGTLTPQQSRQLYEAQQLQNKLTMEQAVADAGAVEVGGDVAGIRAMSTKEAQEFKNYTDQYSTFTRDRMGGELTDAVAAYNAEKSDDNALRLRAAIATAEQRGMNKEMLMALGDTELTAKNSKDAKILGQMASSQNKVISQYGKQMGKTSNVDQSLSLDQFAGSQGGVKMSEAFANQGSNVLNGMDDDTLEYVKTKGRSAATSDMLLNAATSTTNQKELRQINDMLATADADNINFSGRQLANFDNTTMETLASRIKKDSALQQKFITASNDIANSPELMGSLSPERRAMIDAIRKGYDGADGTFEVPRGGAGGTGGTGGTGGGASQGGQEFSGGEGI